MHSPDVTTEQQRSIPAFSYTRKKLDLSAQLLSAARTRTLAVHADSPLGGGLAFYCTADLTTRSIVETASVASAFRGYEALLPGRDLNQVGRVSSTASGICGGVHATASALCLEMALGLQPPPLGIVVRNLLLSCQYLNDNTMHLYILAGPDYSEAVIRKTNPELWAKAATALTEHRAIHGYRSIGDIMLDLNKPDGKLYHKAMAMVRTARKAYAILGGRYPHSESIIPGGVTLSPTLEILEGYRQALQPFLDYSHQTIAIWNDIFDFMLAAQPRYEALGKTSPSMLDFGQWDHEAYYDASYAHCDRWGEQRWSTPGAVIDGHLKTTRLTQMNIGLEEFVEHSFYAPWTDYPMKTDPLGNVLSPNHPCNKTTSPLKDQTTADQAYSWGVTTTWDRHIFEVGAYARVYISALAGKLPASRYLQSTGRSLILNTGKAASPAWRATWNIPPVWNAFERNRARAFALAFNTMVTLENYDRAKALIRRGETAMSTAMTGAPSGRRQGMGLWGAGRGFLAHWASLNDGVIERYQISVPSRINASPRTPWGALGPCEQALLNTPILETNVKHAADLTGIDIQRSLQSFDPCMPSTAHIVLAGSDTVLERTIDTSFPI